MEKGIVPYSGIDTDENGGAIVIQRKDGFSDINYI
jgi:hypothetical protein